MTIRSIRGTLIRAIVLPVVLMLAGCEGFLPSNSVQLLTGIPEGGEDCHLLPHEGLLVVDPNYGTAVIDQTFFEPGSRPVTMAWRPGFVGRRVGSEVEVVDPDGRVAATTGRRITYYPGGSVVAGVKAVWNCAQWKSWPAMPSR